jgi:hypothetical protein
MAIEGKELAILKAVDKAAIMRELAVACSVGGKTFWEIFHDADDVGLGNWCDTWDVSEGDALVLAAAYGDCLAWQKILGAMNSHITTSASADRWGLGYANWRAFFGLLTSDDADLGKFWRAPWMFAELYYDRFRSRLLPINVGAKGILSGTLFADGDTAGLHKFGALTRSGSPTEWIAGSDGDLDTDLTVGAPILINSQTTSGGTGITASITAKKISSAGAAGTKAYTGVACPNAGEDTDPIVLGALTITTGPAAGQETIACNIAAAAVAAGDYVLIYESDVLQEIAEVASMNAGTPGSVVLAKNLAHAYTNAAKIWPLYTGISAASCSAGTAAKAVGLYARPDRIITQGS